MSFVLGEQRHTVAYLDKPTNPEEARFSERDYGRFGSYFEYELDGDKTLDVNYRIWLQKGEMAVQDVAAKSNVRSREPSTTLVLCGWLPVQGVERRNAGAVLSSAVP